MVKTKFKHTDIGLIPEDWEVKTLGEVGEVFGGSTPSTKNLAYWNGNINWFTPTDIGKVKYLYSSSRKITEEGLSSCSARILPINTILITTRAGIGDLGILKSPSATNQGFQSLIPKTDINCEYLYYLLSTLKSIFIKNASGSTFLEISPSKVKSIQIPLPPFAEQQAIAEVLSDTDRWIESLENLIAKKQLIKQGIMQKLLTPKENWEVKRLGDCLDYIQPTPFLVKSADYKPSNNIPVLTAGKTFILGYTNETAGIFNNLPTIIFDDFTTASKYVNFPFKAKSSAMKMLILKNNDNNLKYLSYSMMSLKFQVGDHKRHWIREFQNIEIPLPPIAEQTKIASILSDMDAEIEILEQKLAKAQQIKQGLMRELLTGKIRLVISQVKKEIKPLKKHNNHFNDAVLIGVMASCLGSENFPLTRFRYTKVSYLLKRYKDEQITEYLKKAAGPYNPKTRYGGAEKIAIENKYVAIKKRSYKGKEYEGFLEAENIEQALGYFNRWYGEGALNFIKQFKYETNNNLELLATVDMAIQDLKEENKEINLNSIKQFIRENEEWRDKLNRSAFCDENIEIAIKRLDNLYN
ncbi:type I restriction endonuclease subunit S [Capnocytophaga sp. H4358]|uniref:restriction endonuclease subunit S n=1 Tax=Capnocytophaga sp. H4358 TaxID=1945658 RepID=UPI000BB18216|nr:restriction endonuclease subunit S [Capnocytophaga sp. H4358]ATA73599.1 type I restriction endonuclease subunit S [Capnocytophaga sp. H4358]